MVVMQMIIMKEKDLKICSRNQIYFQMKILINIMIMIHYLKFRPKHKSNLMKKCGFMKDENGLQLQISERFAKKEIVLMAKIQLNPFFIHGKIMI